MAVRVPAKPPDRLTLMPVVLNCGRNTYFLASGENKRKVLAALRSEPESKLTEYPAARIRPSGRAVWFLDQAAGG